MTWCPFRAVRNTTGWGWISNHSPSLKTCSLCRFSSSQDRSFRSESNLIGPIFWRGSNDWTSGLGVPLVYSPPRPPKEVSCPGQLIFILNPPLFAHPFYSAKYFKLSWVKNFVNLLQGRSKSLPVKSVFIFLLELHVSYGHNCLT